MPKYRVETTNGTYIVETEELKPGSKEWAADREAQLAANYERYDAGENAPGSKAPDFSVGGFLSGAANTVKGLYDAGKRILTPPETTADKAAFAVAGPLGPLAKDIALSHVDTGRKAIDAAKRGSYVEAAGYAGATALPMVGPATAATAEKIGEGKFSEAGGEIVSGAVLPKVISQSKHLKKVPVLPKIIREGLKNSEDAAAVDFARRRGVRLDPATETGSDTARNLQKHVQNTVGGSRRAREFREGQTADLERVGDELLNEVSPSSASPELAGERVRGDVNATIGEKARGARKEYKTLEDIEADPANLETIQTGIDPETKKPVYEDIALPVDTRPIKAALKPVEREYLRVLPDAQRRADPTLHAIRQILDGPDYIPASAAEKNLGLLKQHRHVGDGGVDIAEGLASKAIREYDLAIRTKVKQAKRTAPKTAPAGQTVTPAAAQAAAGPAAVPNPNLTGVVGTGETRIRIPGEPTTYKGRYEVRELGDLEASHSGQTFQRNPNYQLANDRDYTRIDNQGKVIEGSSPDLFEPLELINDSPSATTGPAAVDAAGNVLGGNGRKMILDRAYANPQLATAYRQALESKAAQFGLDPEAIKGMKQPVLVRVLDDADLPDTAARQRAITDFNKKGTAELRPSERAIADSRRVSQGTLDDLARRLGEAGDDSTLAQVLEGPAGSEILQKLIDDGVITAQERGALAEGQILTRAGRDRIGSLMLGRFFRNPQQLDAIPSSIRNKLERMAAPLSKAEAVQGWNLTGTIQDAIELLEEARATGTANLDDFMRQGGLFQSEKFSPEAVQLAKQLQSGKLRQLEAAAQQYASDAAFAEGGSLFGDAPTPARSFGEYFGGEVSETVPFDAPTPAAKAAAGAAAAPKPAAPPVARPKVQSISAGDEAWDALTSGRKLTYEKWRADRVLSKISEEPVKAFERLTNDKDRSIVHLRNAAREAPGSVEGIARAYVEGLLEQLKTGRFANGQTVLNAWQKLGPATKELLFKHPAMRKNLDEFFQLAANVSKNPNPSGTAGVSAMTQQVVGLSNAGLTIWNPAAGGAALAGQGAYLLANNVLSRMLFTPKGVQALKNGLRVNVANKAAATLAAGQILKMAGKDAQPLPLAAEYSPSQSTEELQAVASR
jgi:DdrB-like nuclease